MRALGRWTLATLVVNAIVGSGIFGLPATISRLVGPAAPWIWLAGAAGNGVLMLCFAEVASRFQAAGGAYLYARAALPRALAIGVGWLTLAVRALSAAAGANLFTVNLAEFYPQVEREAVRLVVLTLLLAPMTALNVHSVRDGARWSNFFTAAKLVPLALLLAAGVAWIAGQGAVAPAPELAARGGENASWLQAFLLLAFAYGGYDGALLAMGEAKNPRRDAPFALLVAMVTLGILFSSIQWVVDGLLADPAASPRPLVAAASVVLGPWGGALLAAGALISIAGYLGANLLSSPRLVFAFAEQGDLPHGVGRVHPRFRTPWLAIVLFSALVWLLAARGSFEWNAALSGIARLFILGSTCVALLVLRRRRPGEALFTLPGGALLPVLGLAFCALLATRMGAFELALLAAVAGLSTLHWALVRKRTL